MEAPVASGVLFVVLFAILQPPPDSFLDDLGSVVFIVALVLLLGDSWGSTPCRRPTTGASGARGLKKRDKGVVAGESAEQKKSGVVVP